MTYPGDSHLGNKETVRAEERAKWVAAFEEVGIVVEAGDATPGFYVQALRAPRTNTEGHQVVQLDLDTGATVIFHVPTDTVSRAINFAKAHLTPESLFQNAAILTNPPVAGVSVDEIRELEEANWDMRACLSRIREKAKLAVGYENKFCVESGATTKGRDAEDAVDLLMANYAGLQTRHNEAVAEALRLLNPVERTAGEDILQLLGIPRGSGKKVSEAAAAISKLMGPEDEDGSGKPETEEFIERMEERMVDPNPGQSAALEMGLEQCRARIAEIIQDVDKRRMGFGGFGGSGPATSTAQEMTQEELLEIYELANRTHWEPLARIAKIIRQVGSRRSVGATTLQEITKEEMREIYKLANGTE